jgi:phosphoglucosamine mutase
MSELAAIMRRLPQVLVNVRGVDRDRLADAQALWDAVEQAEAELAGKGRVLVRASGTEPVVRVMVEAGSEEHAGEVAERLAGVAKEQLAL